VIEVEELTRRYRSRTGAFRRRAAVVEALRGVSFSVERGELFGLLGPNGAGKTTMIKVLTTLLLPTSGSARVLGFDVRREARRIRGRIGYVFGGDRGLYDRLSALDNLRYFADLYRVPPRTRSARIDSLLELVDLKGRERERVETYSRGMKQRLHIARGLLHDPEILFLDEPTIGLDVVSQKRVREFLRLYNSEHRIVTMLTSHYMQDIEELCDRVIIIDHGKIFFDGPLDSIIDRFSGYKIISLTFQTPGERDFTGLGEELEKTPLSVQLKVPRAKVTETCRQVLAECAVVDISVQELPVEEVIRQLFGEHDASRASAQAALATS